MGNRDARGPFDDVGPAGGVGDLLDFALRWGLLAASHGVWFVFFTGGALLRRRLLMIYENWVGPFTQLTRISLGKITSGWPRAFAFRLSFRF